MANLKLQYAEGKYWEFKAPTFQRPTSIAALILTLARWLQIGSLIAFVAALPLIEAMTDGRVSIGKWLIIVAAVQLGCLITSVLLTGTKYTIDPPLFVQVLVFALMVITAYLFASNNPRNTFGIGEMLYLGGLMIMSAICLYYSVASSITSTMKLRLLTSTIGFAAVTAIVINFLQLGTWEKTAAVAAVFLPALVITAIWGESKWWRAAATAAAAMVLYALIAKGTLIAFWYLILAAVVLAVMAILLYIREGKSGSWREFKRDQSAYLSGELSFGQLITRQRVIVVTLVIAFILIATLLMAYQRRLDLAAALQTYGNEYQKAFTRISTWPTLASGIGAAAGVGVTTWRTVVSFNGLLGVVGYLVLTVSAIWFAVKALNASHTGSKLRSFVPLLLAPIVIAVPLSGFVLQISTVVMLLWWISVGVLVGEALLPTRSDNWQLNTFAPKLLQRFPAKYVNLIPLVIAVIIFAALVFIAAQLITQVI